MAATAQQKGPEGPKDYHPSLRSPPGLEKMLDTYMSYQKEDAQEKVRGVHTTHMDEFYQTLKSHLIERHGKDDRGHPKKHSYHDYKNPDDPKDKNAKEKVAQELANKVIYKALELKHGKKYADAILAAHKINGKTFELHASEFGGKIDYDTMVAFFKGSKNILADFYDGKSEIAKLINTYASATSQPKDMDNIVPHIVNEDNRLAVVGYVNKKMADHGKKKGHNLRVKLDAKIDKILGELQGLANPDHYFPNKEAKHIEPVPEEKKK